MALEDARAIARSIQSKPRKEPAKGNLTNEEKVVILTLLERQVSVDDIAHNLNRNRASIYKFIQRMQDTSLLAKATLRAGAVNLAERVIKKANVSEAIDVLSRPDIGALAPPPSRLPTPAAGGGGIHVSVGIMSCGTVTKVEVTDGNTIPGVTIDQPAVKGILETAQQIQSTRGVEIQGSQDRHGALVNREKDV